MKIAQINATCGQGSTGRICAAISDALLARSIENRIFYCVGQSSHPVGVKYATSRRVKIATLESRIKGNWGFEAHAATRSLIAQLKAFEPDVVHLHNLHSHACNLDMLFAWLKAQGVKVVWTFHDCWAFTGYCTYYSMAGCSKWQSGCGACPQRKSYSWLRDESAALWESKKNIAQDIDLTVVAPSEWMARQARESFFEGYPIRVIHNGIDLDVFRPRESDWANRHDCGGKHIVLGVAFGWERRKGLDMFCNLAERLDSREFQVVLVGTDDVVDKQLPKNIISVHRTHNQEELAQIYSAASVFVNPTREENFPTVNLEALACGAPVVTFDTGGSPEAIDEACGAVVSDDTEALASAIEYICVQRIFPKQACEKRASQFGKQSMALEYLSLYGTLIKDGQ